MIPAFRHMGGKARLRTWLAAKFAAAAFYIEPFTGKGNVFFAVHNRYKASLLADIDISFLLALKEVDLNLLPILVTKEQFEYYKIANNDIAKVIEPRITFAGKGYKAGFSGSSGTHVGYNGLLYKKICLAAKLALIQADLRQWSFEHTLRLSTSECFVYLDPPYYNTKANYNNIDHEFLISILNLACYKWAISGYASPLYDTSLKFKNRYACIRNSEIKGSNSKQKEDVEEILWTNY